MKADDALPAAYAVLRRTIDGDPVVLSVAEAIALHSAMWDLRRGAKAADKLRADWSEREAQLVGQVLSEESRAVTAERERDKALAALQQMLGVIAGVRARGLKWTQAAGTIAKAEALATVLRGGG